MASARKVARLKDKLYYTIGEIAKAFNVNASLIRFWEKEFSIISPRKTSSGSRKFSPDDVKKSLKLMLEATSLI
ncbi:MAG: MerR family transcriptional regulator, partial [Alloprevotella sp.]